MIEFLAEWLVSLLMPAQGVLEARAPHLSFMLQKDYWFRQIYLGLKVTASFGRSESYTRVVDGQVRCITPDSTSQQLQVVWNIQYVTAFIPAWMVPPIFHSVQRDTLKNPKQPGELGHRTIRPTWFEDDTSLHGQKPVPTQGSPQEMHGLKLMIREEIMPQDELPSFPALAHLAESGFLAPDAWNCRKLQVSLKVAIDVPMLGTIIETTVGLTRSKSLTILVSPLDMLGLMGMAQVVATIAYGIRGLRTGETTWSWPDFHSDPTQENLAQIQRWSLNQAPDWTYPPLAIANQYRDRHTKEIKRERYRLILVRGYELDWLRGDLLRRTREENGKSNWIPKQELPFTEIVLYAYAADCTPYPTYVMLPTGLHKARTGALVPRQGPHQEIIPLPGIYFFDGWRVEPSLKIPDNLPQTQDMPVRITARAPAQGAAPRQAPEDEARDILAAAAKNQIECGPSTRRAAARAIKYLRTLVHKHGATINEIHTQARLHTQKSKGVIEPGK